MQHADHFTRIMNEQENLRKAKLVDNKAVNLETSLGITIFSAELRSHPAALSREELFSTFADDQVSNYSV